MAWIGASLNQRMHCQLLMDTSVFSIVFSQLRTAQRGS